ncbi:hypothetical protein [Marmoricola sp. URHB0036]|uniref:hypothetical protein n=1 Tax=Marmoricola sp. URHB0036 TaxID=1298863 RepID=UPI000485D3CD|nr:hypothetical protein [Marmoricola sp. URHB0036]
MRFLRSLLGGLLWLLASLEAEETLQLPARDATKTEKGSAKAKEDVARGRQLRLSRGESQETGHGTGDTGTGPAKEKSDGTN